MSASRYKLLSSNSRPCQCPHLPPPGDWKVATSSPLSPHSSHSEFSIAVSVWSTCSCRISACGHIIFLDVKIIYICLLFCSHYFLHLLKMLKCPLLLTLLTLVFLTLLLLSSVGTVPIHTSHSARAVAASNEDTLFLTGLPSPPAAPIREERQASPTAPSPTAPIILPFIKVRKHITSLLTLIQ